MKGDSMGISVFILAILCLGIVGVYMYYKAETNSYNDLVNKIQAMQTEIHSNADSIKQLSESIQKHDEMDKLFLGLGESSTNNFQKIYSDLDKIHERIAKIKESQQLEKSRPLMMDFKWPKEPIVVEVSKLPSRSRVYRSQTTVQKTKAGLLHKTTGKAIEKNHERVHPAIKQTKETMKAMDF